MSMHHNVAAYIAGLFDGEGSVTFKKYKEKKKKNGQVREYMCQRIRLEIAMTDEHTIRYVHEVTGVGTVRPKRRPKGMKPQWRWQCSFRDAYNICLQIWPFVQTKLHQIDKIIDYYTDQEMEQLEQYAKTNNKADVVDLSEYRRLLSRKN